jgi:hypothetical protein
MKVYGSPHKDVRLPEVDILTLLFGMDAALMSRLNTGV